MDHQSHTPQKSPAGPGERDGQAALQASRGGGGGARALLNPDSPAFVPAAAPPASAPPTSPAGPLRREPCVFTPTKAARRAAPSARHALRPLVWMDEGVERELIHHNHWLLYESVSGDWPRDVHGYHSFLPTRTLAEYDITASVPGDLAPDGLTTVRARRHSDGRLYTLHLVHGFVLQDAGVFAALDPYRRFESAYVVPLVEAFTTRQFGRDDLVFVYESIPGAVRLERAQEGLWGEEYLQCLECWIRQSLVTLHHVHSSGLYLGSALDRGNLLIPPSLDRFVLQGLGMSHLLAVLRGSDQGRTLEEQKSADYERLCKVFDDLLPPAPPHNSEAFARIKGLIGSIPPRWDYSCEGLGAALLQLQVLSGLLLSQQKRCALLEDQLSLQLEKDRLFRVVCKLGFINERQSHAHDLQWSETGDRYVLKLFRDFVFHSQDENGLPVIDLFHVIAVLNKLDSGTNEPLVLMSRDGSQCILATYGEIRKRLEAAYSELAGS